MHYYFNLKEGRNLFNFLLVPAAMSFFRLLLTEYRRSGASGLTRATVYVKVRVAGGPPLAQDARGCMDHVHKMGIRFV